MPKLGVVSFLNSQPLIVGLDQHDELDLRFEVPAQLPHLLASGAVDVALAPIIDVLRAEQPWSIVCDACIGSFGETMTVRVFSQLPPDKIKTLHVDGDSHTSVALATILWRELYGTALELAPLKDLAAEQPEAVLLIGDKVVDPARAGYAFEVDLGGAWQQLTGLPFVFAVWAAREPQPLVGEWLEAARDRGLAQLEEIAARIGPSHGWTAPLATRYLVHRLRFKLDEQLVAGAQRFAELARHYDLAPPLATLSWPQKLTPTTRVST